ncbi:hypothetical protein K458DRAFT_82087 [Lentithecium fluviatile CBS 122367]|uniref:Uncharacterized protein n=1 Tax=Lentithecium fluviatile CBS 122367 TaxID=1168545 RepID=A0A6G1ITI4_9PLEO|nr:hypothetical protein K458DRAFT_82087 [Lentithecium fluviatile CBS 122367]
MQGRPPLRGRVRAELATRRGPGLRRLASRHLLKQRSPAQTMEPLAHCSPSCHRRLSAACTLSKPSVLRRAAHDAGASRKQHVAHASAVCIGAASFHAGAHRIHAPQHRLPLRT